MDGVSTLGRGMDALWDPVTAIARWDDYIWRTTNGGISASVKVSVEVAMSLSSQMAGRIDTIEAELSNGLTRRAVLLMLIVFSLDPFTLCNVLFPAKPADRCLG